MQKYRRLIVALVMVMAATAGHAWIADPPVVPEPGVSVFCPEIPPDCCLLKRINGCWVCIQAGC